MDLKINAAMIHKTKSLSLAAAAALFACATLLNSCKKDSSDPISADVKSSVSNEATMESVEDEIDDISSAQMQAASSVPGRMQAVSDARVACAKITVLLGDKYGKIRINFDSTNTAASAAGCTDALGNTRKGLIEIDWNGGKWYTAGTAAIITAANYSINGVVINGQRTLTNITDANHALVIVWTVLAVDTKFAFADNTTSTRTVNKTKTWDTQQGTVTITQTSGADNAISGTNRLGHTYTVSITNGILYTVECVTANKVFIPVSGTQTLTIDSSTSLTFDYGDGTCDDTFTITDKNFTETITATNSGS